MVFSRVQEAACRARRVSLLRTGKANESLFTSTVEHSCYCLDFFFFLFLRLGNLDRLRRECEFKLGRIEGRKERSNEGQLFGNIVKRMSPDKTKESLDLK